MHTVAGTALWVTAQLLPAAPPPPGLGGALLQELPAIHINPLLDRMMTYSGDTPFTEATVDSVKVCSLSLSLSLSLALTLSRTPSLSYSHSPSPLSLTGRWGIR
jgi:hypothetical protein